MNKPIAFLLIILSLLPSLLASSQELSYEAFQQGQVIVPNRVNSEWAKAQEYVVMISIDGFRYDYAEQFRATNILSLIATGASAERLIPSFPSKTFPNHYTLVTGMRPGSHGLVGNTFYSRKKNDWYKIGKKSAVLDGSWYGGKPLWVLSEQQQMLSASLFWVGSEANIENTYPTYRYAYDGRVPNAYRLRQVMDWLKLPDSTRPHMITTYFSIVDDAGHRYGPDHEETRKAVMEVDQLLGALMQELQQLDLKVNVVLVSDHGMSSISRGVVLPDLVDLKDARVSYSFPPMIYQPDKGKLEVLYQQLLALDQIDVYKSSQVPDYLDFKNQDRIGDLILLSAPPTVIIDKPRRVYGGTHGFDPYTQVEMGGIFYAWGTSIRTGVELPPVENIHVFPVIAEILGLQYDEQSIEGRLQPLAPVLVDQ